MLSENLNKIFNRYWKIFQKQKNLVEISDTNGVKKSSV